MQGISADSGSSRYRCFSGALNCSKLISIHMRRSYFGSLLVDYQSPDGLVFAGRVGTGFSDKVFANLYAKFQKLRVPSCPFVNLPEKSKGRWTLGIAPAVMKRCHWLKPALVAQVKFTEWTLDDQLRQPVFLRLRNDKQPDDVVRE